MALTTVPAAGGKLRAAVLQALVGEVRAVEAIKAVDESLTANTTLQDDDELQLAVEANATYSFTMQLRYDATTTSDIKTQFSLPTGGTMFYAMQGIAAATSVYNGFDLNETSVPIFEGGGAGTVRVVSAGGHIVTLSSAGTAKLKWAQSTSGGTATIVKAGSSFVIRRIA
jgi:hypothetical protein